MGGDSGRLSGSWLGLHELRGGGPCELCGLVWVKWEERADINLPVKFFTYVITSVITFLFFKIMGKFFFGIVQSGAWCCFTDFSRPEAGVLSVVASQILAIKAAKDSYSVR